VRLRRIARRAPLRTEAARRRALRSAARRAVLRTLRPGATCAARNEP
jgi:hypothetical protein